MVEPKPLKFKCKNCGAVRIEEVVQDAVIGFEVEVDAEGLYLKNESYEQYEGQVSHYQCLTCGLEIETDSTDPEGLAEALKENYPQGDEEDDN